MKQGLTEKVIFGGVGGQGINLVGRLLARSAMECGYEVTWLASYGAEIRGGVSCSMVVIGSRKPFTPYIAVPDSVVVMSDACLKKFEPSLKKGGLMVVNSGAVDGRPRRRDLRVVTLDAAEIAEQAGDILAQNMVMLGAYLRIKDFIALETLSVALRQILPEHRKNLYDTNLRAIRRGAEKVARLLDPPIKSEDDIVGEGLVPSR